MLFPALKRYQPMGKNFLSTPVLTPRSENQGISQIDVANRGGLKGSVQHWLAVYPPEFQIPMFFVAVD